MHIQKNRKIIYLKQRNSDEITASQPYENSQQGSINDWQDIQISSESKESNSESENNSRRLSNYLNQNIKEAVDYRIIVDNMNNELLELTIINNKSLQDGKREFLVTPSVLQKHRSESTNNKNDIPSKYFKIIKYIDLITSNYIETLPKSQNSKEDMNESDIFKLSSGSFRS